MTMNLSSLKFLDRAPLLRVIGCSLALLCVSPSAAFSREKPNVLVIIIDDLNDWVGCLGGYPSRQWDRVAAAEFDQ